MKKLIHYFNIFAVLMLVSVRIFAQDDGKLKYVFLFIGDGMGLNQVFITEKYNELTHENPLIFLDYTWAFGLSQTECADSNKITDSGAGGTAIACGQRVSFGDIGEYNGKAVESIAEYLHSKKNFRVGIITSVPINHATPACFYGHEPTRRNYDNLANDLISSGFEFFAGGGFQMGNADTSSKFFRKFDNILQKLNENKFKLVFNEDQLREITVTTNEKILVIDTVIRNQQQKLKNVYADERNSLPFILDVPGQKMKLAEYTEVAEKVLMNDNGFFIMVEGGKIDWACHDNDALTAIYEVNAFNEAIKKAYEFYSKHPENTLIIITADHETGGLALGNRVDEDAPVKKDGYSLFIKKLQQQKGSYIYTSGESLKKIQDDAQVGWTTYDHTSAPVGIWTIGHGSEKFAGVMRNDEFKGKIMELVK